MDTTYFEGSYASGTTAASCAMTNSRSDGVYHYTFRQPAGTLYTTLTMENGNITDIRLGGLLELSDLINIELSSE